MYILIIVLHIIYTIYIKHITKILNKQKIHKFSQFKTSQMKRFQEISIDTEFLEIISDKFEVDEVRYRVVGLINSVTDPWFPRWGGGANPWVWAENLLSGKIFAETCMQMKDIGPGASLAPCLDPPMQLQFHSFAVYGHSVIFLLGLLNLNPDLQFEFFS